MDMNKLKKVELFDADSLEYCGCILVNGTQWEYKDTQDQHMMEITAGMPLKGVLSCLINFNLVYDLIEE